MREQRKHIAELNKRTPHVTTKHGKFKSRRKSKRHSPHTVDDLATLETFDEVLAQLILLFRFTSLILIKIKDSIVTQLFNRFVQGQIYTYIGDILLAVNPFTNLGIYNEEVLFFIVLLSRNLFKRLFVISGRRNIETV